MIEQKPKRTACITCGGDGGRGSSKGRFFANGECAHCWRKRKIASDPTFQARATAAHTEWIRRHPHGLRRIKERQRAKFMADPEHRRLKSIREKAKRVFKKYGLSMAEYGEMMARGCAICGSFKKLSVDHCHRTGKVRDALCHACNIGLGFIERPENWLHRAMAYLIKKGSLYAKTYPDGWHNL